MNDKDKTKEGLIKSTSYNTVG